MWLGVVVLNLELQPRVRDGLWVCLCLMGFGCFYDVLEAGRVCVLDWIECVGFEFVLEGEAGFGSFGQLILGGVFELVGYCFGVLRLAGFGNLDFRKGVGDEFWFLVVGG